MSTKRKREIKDKIIKRQIDEINSLKNTVYDLEIDCREKERLINSINILHEDLTEIVCELKEKSDNYDSLIHELMEMKKAMNQIVFNRKWKLIRWLLK